MALMTDEEFSAFCKAKYCSPTSGLEGAKRIELLEELAKVIMEWTRECRNWSTVNRLCVAIDLDNRRVDRLEKEYDKDFAESLERSRWVQIKKT